MWQRTHNSKKVLIISYHFPPDAEVGGLRAQKFAKYLPAFGWEPVVLSVHEKYYPKHDRERSQDVSCEIVRTGMLLHPRVAYLKVKKALLRLTRKERTSFSANSTSIKESELGFDERSLSKTKRFIFSLLWLPDDRTGWIIPAMIKGLSLLRNLNIQTVITTSPPHSVQLIGLILKKLHHHRWVVDFRDPWSLPLEKAAGFLPRMHRWLEKKVVEHADVIITATKVVRNGYVKTYPDQTSDKFVYVPNGFDPEDFERARMANNTNHTKFVVSYLGDFYVGRSPETFLKALSALTRERIIPMGSLRVRFVGKVRHFGRTFLADIISELGLSPVTEITDLVPYMKAIEYMVESTVLLVFSPQPFFQPTKVFEYIAAGAYIIAFTPAGALADIVNEYPKGIVVDYDDLEGAKNGLIYCYDKFLHSEEVDEAKAREIDEMSRDYDRRHLTQQLSKYL